MREALGMPISVTGASFPQAGGLFFGALFKYPTFSVSYESGIDNVPRFDAHIEIYGQNKTIRVDYDTPYVKGLPTTMHISENVDGALRETTLRTTYEDPYTREMKELYAMIVDGASIKTTAEDARQDLAIFKMIMQAGDFK
jgi:predicted dehydrogenase